MITRDETRKVLTSRDPSSSTLTAGGRDPEAHHTKQSPRRLQWAPRPSNAGSVELRASYLTQHLHHHSCSHFQGSSGHCGIEENLKSKEKSPNPAGSAHSSPQLMASVGWHTGAPPGGGLSQLSWRGQQTKGSLTRCHLRVCRERGQPCQFWLITDGPSVPWLPGKMEAEWVWPAGFGSGPQTGISKRLTAPRGEAHPTTVPTTHGWSQVLIPFLPPWQVSRTSCTQGAVQPSLARTGSRVLAEEWGRAVRRWA